MWVGGVCTYYLQETNIILTEYINNWTINHLPIQGSYNRLDSLDWISIVGFKFTYELMTNSKRSKLDIGKTLVILSMQKSQSVR